MTKTLDLLDQALANGTSARELAKVLKLSPNALNVARHRGHLTPELAQMVAEHLDIDPVQWMALAVVEAQDASPKRDSLLRKIQASLGKSVTHAAAVGVLVMLFCGIAGNAPLAWPRGLRTGR